MLGQERFLITRYVGVSNDWPGWFWWLTHLRTIIASVRQLETGACHAVICGHDGIHRLSRAEYFALLPNACDNPDIKKLADQFHQYLRAEEADKVRKLREPGCN